MENSAAVLKSILIIGMLAGIFLFGIIMDCGNNRDMTMDIEQLFPKESSGWKIEGALEAYDYDGIFKYIDGAGEVYRMYAYREVRVAHYVRENAPNLTVEIFDMGKPEDAFGIFMHSTSGTDSGIGQGSEQVGGVLYFWKNRYFISVYADSRTPESDPAVEKIARAISLAITEEGAEPEIIKYLPKAGNPPAEIKYFHLHTSLNYYYYLSAVNILNLNKDTEAVLARYAPDDSYLVFIGYPDDKAAGDAYRSFIDSYIPEAGDEGIYEIEDDNWTAVKQKGSYLIIVFEATNRESAGNIIRMVYDILP